MALVFMEGWDLRNTVTLRNWVFGEFEGTLSFSAGDISGYAVDLNRYGGTGGVANVNLYRYLPSTYTEFVWGFRFRINSTTPTATHNFCNVLTAAGANIAMIRFGTSGVPVVVNSGGTTIGTGFRSVAGTGWHYLELRIKVNGASGECQLYVDGTQEIATTVGNFGSTNIGGVQWYGRWDDGVSHIYVDDVYVLDTTGGAPLNTFLGDSNIEMLLPTSDGANTDWTPNSGATEYTQVDETPNDGDTTYISDATPTDISTFGCSNLPFTSGTVYAVQTTLVARKDNATLREIRPVIRQAGVDYSVGTVAALSTGYAVYTSLLPLDPVAATWTVSNINADEFGVELVT